MTLNGRERHQDPTRSRTAPVWQRAHEVQFYESEEFLVDCVARFVVEGHKAGQPVIVIATAPHRRALAARLRELGLDVDEFARSWELVILDARETLAAFMEGDRPDPELFEATVGNVFANVMKGRSYVVVRAFGEMVDLLWRDGKAAGAVALEALWNGLARRYAFSLLCAYDKASVTRDGVDKCVADICAAHTRVLVPESDALAVRLGLSA